MKWTRIDNLNNARLELCSALLRNLAVKSPHLSSVISKGTQRAGLLSHMACKLSPELVTKFYLSFVRPILEYASPVPAWHFSISGSEALALERIQASVARKVLRADWLTPKAMLLGQLNWHSLRWRRSVARLTLFHKLITEPSPPLSDCLPPFSSELSARQTRKPLQLVLSRCKSSKRLKSFFQPQPFFGTLSLTTFKS